MLFFFFCILQAIKKLDGGEAWNEAKVYYLSLSRNQFQFRDKCGHISVLQSCSMGAYIKRANEYLNRPTPLFLNGLCSSVAFSIIHRSGRGAKIREDYCTADGCNKQAEQLKTTIDLPNINLIIFPTSAPNPLERKGSGVTSLNPWVCGSVEALQLLV